MIFVVKLECFFFFFFKQKTAYEITASDWSSDVCSSDLFVRVGLAGCDMGACAMLPRIIGQGRAAELLYTGRSMSAEEGHAWGFYNGVAEPVLPAAMEAAQALATGPSAAHAMTKKMLHQEWNA